MTTPPFTRPSIAQVHEVLRRHSALIVHFSSCPKGTGYHSDLVYPRDLHNVIDGGAMSGVSCSVVTPKDSFGGVNKNGTGCVGVVLDLMTSDSLIDVSPDDCGSHVVEGQRRFRDDRDISVADIEHSINERPIGKYNEWLLRNFKVLGVLAVPPFECSTLESVPRPADLHDAYHSDEPTISIGYTTISEVCAQFPTLPVFTFFAGQIVKVEAVGEIYSSELEVGSA